MDTFTKTLRNTQVITFALAGGLVVLMGMVMYMLLEVKPGGFIGGKGPMLGTWPLLSTILCGISFLNLLLSFLIPPMLLNMQLAAWLKTAQPPTGELAAWETNDLTWLEKVPTTTLNPLLAMFQSNKIITVALCEGTGVLCAVAYLLEAQWFAIVLLLLAIAAMLVRVATKGSLNEWLYAQITKLQQSKGAEPR